MKKNISLKREKKKQKQPNTFFYLKLLLFEKSVLQMVFFTSGLAESNCNIGSSVNFLLDGCRKERH